MRCWKADIPISSELLNAYNWLFLLMSANYLIFYFQIWLFSCTFIHQIVNTHCASKHPYYWERGVPGMSHFILFQRTILSCWWRLFSSFFPAENHYPHRCYIVFFQNTWTRRICRAPDVPGFKLFSRFVQFFKSVFLGNNSFDYVNPVLNLKHAICWICKEDAMSLFTFLATCSLNFNFDCLFRSGFPLQLFLRLLSSLKSP